MLCDVGLDGEKLSFLNTCSAFVLMLSGTVVALLIAMQERIIGRRKKVTQRRKEEKITTYELHQPSHSTTNISRWDCRESRSKSIVKMRIERGIFIGQPKQLKEDVVHYEFNKYFGGLLLHVEWLYRARFGKNTEKMYVQHRAPRNNPVEGSENIARFFREVSQWTTLSRKC